jgi:hypothetical protein
VRGYIHWTITDNWEWTFGYQPFARFGLFTVERPDAPPTEAPTSFRRRATIGALAYGSIVGRARSAGTSATESLFDAIVKRFGAIDPAGKRLVHPTLQVGGFWRGRWVDGGEDFLLHLRRMNDAEWQGVFYDTASQRWSPLESIVWVKEGRSSGRLTFKVGHGALNVSASTRRAPAENEPELVGEATGAGGVRQFEARRVLLERAFSRSRAPGVPCSPDSYESSRTRRGGSQRPRGTVLRGRQPATSMSPKTAGRWPSRSPTGGGSTAGCKGIASSERSRVHSRGRGGLWTTHCRSLDGGGRPHHIRECPGGSAT